MICAWNLTGLYKSSRDRAPAKRSRRIASVSPSAKLVMPRAECRECDKCGERTDSTTHFILCVEPSAFAEEAPPQGKK